MISWIQLAATAAAGLALIAVLGVPSALALRLRGFPLVLVSIPAAFAVIALSSIVAPFVGVPWSPLPALVLAALLALVLLALRRWIGAPKPSGGADDARLLRRLSLRDLWVSVGSAAIGGGFLAALLLTVLPSGDSISQTFDANFHLNAVRYILDSGSASPMTMDLTSPGAPVFYPTLWHATVALIVDITGMSIPVATNALLFIAACVVWPLGVVALGRAIAGPSLRVTIISGTVSTLFPNFPLHLTGYGILYPNLLALVLLPMLMVATLQLLNLGPARRTLPLSMGTRWLLFLGALGAAALAHPSAIHVFLVWAAFPVLFAAFRAFRGGQVLSDAGEFALPSRSLLARRVLAVSGVAVFAVVTALAWRAGRTSDNLWEGFYTPSAALQELVGGTPHLEGHFWALSIAIVVGAILAWRHRPMRWVLGGAVVFAALYFLADGFPTSDFRSLFLSPWYNDPRRLAALVPFGALPLVILAASAAWMILRIGLRRMSRALTRRSGLSNAFGAVLAILLVLSIGNSGMASAKSIVRGYYDAEKGLLLSHDEEKLLERLPSEVPEGSVIANNPLNGSPLSYALADRPVLFPHAGGIYDPRSYELVDSLVAEPLLACEISRELNVSFVLDFGTQYILHDPNRREVPFKRMKDLDKSPILTEVDHQGDAVLYKISNCGTNE